MDISKDWEKLVLLLVSLLTLVVAGLTIKSSLAYGKQFIIKDIPPNSEFPQPEREIVVSSTDLLKEKLVWKSLEIAPDGGGQPRQIPLFNSITIVEFEGQLIDMTNESHPDIRPPIKNKWWLDNQIDFLSQNALTQDPDGDGFNNLEEYQKKTSPTDASEHPPLADKLKLLARRQQSYVLEFSAQPDADRFQITRHKSALYPRDTFFMRKGETSKDNKFRVDSFEKKEAVNNLGIKVDASELTITYLEDGRTVKLVRNVKEVIPTYFALFKLDLPGGGEEFHVKKGETFRLSIDPETEYKLIDITQEKAVISFESEPGKEVTIEIKLSNQPNN